MGDIFDAAGKNIDINNFKTDILADDIEEYQLDFEDTRYVKGGTINPKEFSHENWTQWEDRIYNYFTSRKSIRGVPLYYAIRKNTPSPEESENRDVKIIYQASLVGTCLPDTQGKLSIFSKN